MKFAIFADFWYHLHRSGTDFPSFVGLTFVCVIQQFLGATNSNQQQPKGLRVMYLVSLSLQTHVCLTPFAEEGANVVNEQYKGQETDDAGANEHHKPDGFEN